jgi:hypothetical protein
MKGSGTPTHFGSVNVSEGRRANDDCDECTHPH